MALQMIMPSRKLITISILITIHCLSAYYLHATPHHPKMYRVIRVTKSTVSYGSINIQLQHDGIDSNGIGTRDIFQEISTDDGCPNIIHKAELFLRASFVQIASIILNHRVIHNHFQESMLLHLITECFVKTFAAADYTHWNVVEPSQWPYTQYGFFDATIGHSVLNKAIVLPMKTELSTFNYINATFTHYGESMLSSAFQSTYGGPYFTQVGNLLYSMAPGYYFSSSFDNAMNTVNVDTLEYNEDVGLYIDGSYSYICLTSAQDRYIIQTGGSSNNEFHIYDTFNYSARIDGPNMTYRHSHTCIVVQNHLFVIGGTTSSVQYINVSDVTAVGSQSWVTLGDLVGERENAVSILLDYDIVVVSGMNGTYPYHYITAVEIINTLTNSVSIGGYLPVGVRSAVGFAINRIVYLFGGSNSNSKLNGYQTVNTQPSPSPSKAPSLNGSTAPSKSTDHPSKTPSKSPSRTPTDSPSKVPSDHPSKTPSEWPSNVPSRSPSDAPTDATQSPSKSPSDHPSRAPSDHPTSPSQTPSEYPSRVPSDHPSNVPSKSPSKTPSDSPSDAPTESPSNSPSDTPSNAPTMSPSDSPTRSPSDLPTDSPTRHPTADDAFSKELVVTFSILGWAQMQIEDEGVFIVSMISIFRDAYVIVSGKFADLSIGEQLEYRFFDILIEKEQLNLENLTIPMSAKYQEDNVGDAIRFISRQNAFREEVEDQFTDTFKDEEGLPFNLSFNLLSVSVPETPDSVEVFDYVFPLLATFMTTSLLIALGAFVFNKKDTKIDDAAWTSLVMFGLQVFDLGSDVNLCVEIILQFESVFELSLLYISGYGSLLFVIVPYIANIILASKMKEIVAGNGAAVSYFEQRSALFVTLVIFSGGAYPVLALMSSRIFALEIFDCGLTRYELMRLSKLKIFGTVVLENLPQMCLQLMYISYSGTPSQNTILSSVASFLSILGACLSYCIQKQGGDCFVNQYDLQFRKTNHQSLTESEKNQILAKKECKKALRYSLSSALDVIETQMELGFVNMTQAGFVIHVVHYTSKQQLNNFNDAGSFYGDDDETDNQLYAHLVAVFTERLYSVKSEEVKDAFNAHFGFDKEFKVKYHKHFGYNALLYKSTANVLGETKNTEMELALSIATKDEAKESDVQHVQTLLHNLVTALANIQISDEDRDRLFAQFAEQNNKELIGDIIRTFKVKKSDDDIEIVFEDEDEDDVKAKEEVPVEVELADTITDGIVGELNELTITKQS
eukprot:771504_1